MSELMVVKSKIAEYIRNKHQAQIGGDLVEELSAKVTQLVDDAVRRCKSNGKTVVKAKHL